MPDETNDLPSLEALSRKIEKAKPIADDATSDAGDSYIGYAFRFTMDLFAGLLVGAGLGYGIDWYFGSLPWATLVGIGFGLAAGIRNMIRGAKEMEKDVE